MPPTEAPAGATPAAEGATPSQSQPAQPAPGTSPQQQPAPATGTDEPLGEAGLRALAAERKRADDAEKAVKAAQTRVEELENATASDQEKAVNAARKEGETEERKRSDTIIRGLRIEGALRDAGCMKPGLAARSSEFEALKVADDGSIDGLDGAVTTFKAANPELFPPTKPSGGVDQGARGTPAAADTGPGLARLRSVQRNNASRQSR